MEQKLHKSRTNKIIDGVCGGIAEYFDIDPVLVRVLFVLLSFGGGSGVLMYIILAIIMPEEGALSSKAEVVTDKEKKDEVVTNRSSRRETGKNIGAIFLIIIGGIFLLETTGFHLIGTFFSSAFRFWPALLIILGITMLFRKDDERN